MLVRTGFILSLAISSKRCRGPSLGARMPSPQAPLLWRINRVRIVLRFLEPKSKLVFYHDVGPFGPPRWRLSACHQLEALAFPWQIILCTVPST